MSRQFEASFAPQESWLLTLRMQEEVDAQSYGQQLGQAIFVDAIGRAFHQAYGHCLATKELLRVLLYVEADDQPLRALRWERLCVPLDESWRPLARSQRCLFAIALPTTSGVSYPLVKRQQLRALVVVCSPPADNRYGLDSFEIKPVLSSLSAGLAGVPYDILAEPEHLQRRLGRPTLDALCERLTVARYTLLHLVCHGRLAENPAGKEERETMLFLGGESAAEVVPVYASKLIDRLRDLGGLNGLPHMVFLSACETAGAAAEGVLGGLGQQLVRELGTPAVIAMSARVSLHAAVGLSQRFYQRLWSHGQADLALSQASNALADTPEAATPVLFSRLAGRPLFDTEDEAHPASPAAPRRRTRTAAAVLVACALTACVLGALVWRNLGDRAHRPSPPEQSDMNKAASQPPPAVPGRPAESPDGSAALAVQVVPQPPPSSGTGASPLAPAKVAPPARAPGSPANGTDHSEVLVIRRKSRSDQRPPPVSPPTSPPPILECLSGKRASAGHCCWPGQSWDDGVQHCSGNARCPSKFFPSPSGLDVSELDHCLPEPILERRLQASRSGCSCITQEEVLYECILDADTLKIRPRET